MTRILNFIILIIGFATLSSCISSSMLYKRGNANPSEFASQTSFERNVGLMIVPVKIEDKTYRFLFDTGAPMVISKEIRESLELKRKGKGGVRDSQNERQQLEFVTLPSLEIGNVSFSKLVAISADLKASPAIACLNIDGIIGANLMRQASWKIDFKTNELYFQSTAFELSDPSYQIPFDTKSTFTPVIALKVDNEEIQNVTFDSGSAGFLTIGSNKLGEGWLDSLHRDSWGYHSSGLFGSKKDSLTYQRFDINLGNLEPFEAICKVEQSKQKALLGIKFMENYDVYLDWSKNEVNLVSTKKLKQKNTSYGFSPKITTDSLFIVGSVLFNSDAARMGVTVGDTILNIYPAHQKKARSMGYCELGEKMRNWKGPIILERLNKQPLIIKREEVLPSLSSEQ